MPIVWSHGAEKSGQVQFFQPFSIPPADRTPEEGDKPGSVVLLRVPDLKELRTRQVQGLVDAELFWHPDGDFLAARTDRLGAKVGFSVFSLPLLL